MSLYDYQRSRALAAQDEPFYALIMAAMRKADTHNYALLHDAFPTIGRELQDRYHAPGGVLPGDPETVQP